MALSAPMWYRRDGRPGGVSARMTRTIVGLGSLIAILILAGCGSSNSSSPSPTATPKSSGASGSGSYTVGLVLDVGGVNDKGFNHLAYLGLKEAESKYAVSGQYVVSTSQSDYIPNITRFAKTKELTIANGFLMQQPMLQITKQYPNKKFGIVDGCPADAKGNCHNQPNVANLLFKEQESGYLVGVIAGLMEKEHIGKATHNTIGFMGGIPVPAVTHYIAGYVAGAQKVDPSIHILSGYSQSFTDQGKGNTIGRAQISQNADILFAVAGGSGLGYLGAAQQEGKYGIGVDADQGYLGKYIITSAIKRVDVAVADTIHGAQTGKFVAGDHRFGLQQGATGFAPPSSIVPASIVSQANQYETKIKNGTIVPPATVPTFH